MMRSFRLGLTMAIFLVASTTEPSKSQPTFIHEQKAKADTHSLCIAESLERSGLACERFYGADPTRGVDRANSGPWR